MRPCSRTALATAVVVASAQLLPSTWMVPASPPVFCRRLHLNPRRVVHGRGYREVTRWRRVSLPAVGSERAQPGSTVREDGQLLQSWKLLKDGRFRGTLPDGLVVEFEGEIVGPQDPGVVLGPDGVRYILGETDKRGDIDAGGPEGSGSPNLVVAVVSAVAATVLALTVLPGVLQRGAAMLSPSEGPVTRTYVTIVESRKTLPDGAEARVIDKTTRRERTVPGKAPVVSEQTKRTERVIKDERVPRAQSLRALKPAPDPPAAPGS